jgi:hypothetical protein
MSDEEPQQQLAGAPQSTQDPVKAEDNTTINIKVNIFLRVHRFRSLFRLS